MQILAIRKNSCFLYFWRTQIGHSVAVLINYDSSKVLCLSMSKLMTFDRIAFPPKTKQVLKTNRKLNDNYQETTDSMIQIWKIKQLVQICLPIICRIVICNNNMECHLSSRLSKLFHFFYFSLELCFLPKFIFKSMCILEQNMTPRCKFYVQIRAILEWSARVSSCFQDTSPVKAKDS